MQYNLYINIIVIILIKWIKFEPNFLLQLIARQKVQQICGRSDAHDADGRDITGPLQKYKFPREISSVSGVGMMSIST